MKTVNIVSFSSNLVSTIISLIIGVILFTRPDLVTIMISYVLGGILIAYGLVKLFYFFYQKGKIPETPYNSCISGTALIIIGLVCIFLSGVIEHIVRFIIGGFILFSGINRLIKAGDLKNQNEHKFISVIIVSIILIVGGLYVIFVSNLVFSSLGLVLIIYSVLEIINYILLAGNNNEKVYSRPEDKNLKTIELKEKKTAKKKTNKKD